MKKLLSTLLSAVLLATSVSVSAAESANVTVTCQTSASSLQVGEEFYADFKVTENQVGFNNVTAIIRFDPDVIEAISCDEDPSDEISYTTDSGKVYQAFTTSFINGRVSFVPEAGNDDFNGLADGVKNAGQLGAIKIAGFLQASKDGYLQNFTTTGTLCRLKFKAVGPGSTDITFESLETGYFEQGEPLSNSVSVQNASVTVAGSRNTDSNDSTETTTSSRISGSSSGGSGSRNTATEATTEETTVLSEQDSNEPTTEASQEVTNPSMPTPELTFTDVPADFWGAEYINSLSKAGIINGYSDGTFRPNDKIKRADFIIMLLKSVDEYDASFSEECFTDVEKESYYFSAVSKAKSLGIANGNGDGTFSPTANITRQDMMILCKNAIEYKFGKELTGDESVLDAFTDKDSISAYAVSALSAMTENGYISGRGSLIAPLDNTTRAEAATIMHKIVTLK